MKAVFSTVFATNCVASVVAYKSVFMNSTGFAPIVAVIALACVSAGAAWCLACAATED